MGTAPERLELLLLARELVEHGAAVAIRGARDADALRGLTLALAGATLVVRIEPASLVATRGFQLELGRLVVFDLEIGDLEFLECARGAQRGVFAGGHGPV